ncbi:ImmA/IrrE family metallo-endopeptidase [Bradyrhizobium japonicum]|uniref:ImmA/IrrE family metallo-endopeptidase n=1 Tax=Bradyrhizobium japonicum TaxID=375 RepID=UPI001E5345B2|nr:ImmA/IrrE family metallo-endopeptidase [Bradyrhizobium japonicum]MCD9824053.1 ImmA/IrrE family metallo-endopeptidase [Bradyrhizobium japonicum]MCD9896607.1 ImmA/IrrE family metallo-endopeptidase [Bradyrhizobium japonicum]MEB2671100.1 ImmA/IrrE family metallo-endopeptidase [Bradyrhizobium japonicum]WLB28659.1 ImmA/IrrE family metallo-endopeptidase [Bradyrhizobium japonicum]WRI90423.1 ImmA/IrrE family metallo-endopeptidase [Bradyrhizobium japonicum]
MSRRPTLPELLLQDFGIDRPEEIDLQAIAWELGARIHVRELHSCEARIVGRGHRAIITIDAKASPRRKRFSIAHELGHWHHHRGRCLICRSDDIGNRKRSATDPERVADDYASDLLLPRYLLEPMLRALRRPTLKAVKETAEAFDASLTATALKIAETDFFPIMLVSHSQQGRAWFRKAPSVPEHWFPKKELDHESYAFSALFGKHEDKGGPRRIGADAWFDRRGAEDFEIYEETFRVAADQICTILFFNDTKMLRD